MLFDIDPKDFWNLSQAHQTPTKIFHYWNCMKIKIQTSCICFILSAVSGDSTTTSFGDLSLFCLRVEISSTIFWSSVEMSLPIETALGLRWINQQFSYISSQPANWRYLWQSTNIHLHLVVRCVIYWVIPLMTSLLRSDCEASAPHHLVPISQFAEHLAQMIARPDDEKWRNASIKVQ